MVKKTILDPQVKKKVKDYVNLLKNEGLDIDKAIVFGSFARGTQRPWSDIDVCIVSKDFGKDPISEAMELAKKARKIDLYLEPHSYHPKDLQEKFDPLAAEIRKYGIPL